MGTVHNTTYGPLNIPLSLLLFAARLIIFSYFQADNDYKVIKFKCFHNPFYIKDSACNFRSVNRSTKVASGHFTIYRQHGDFIVRIHPIKLIPIFGYNLLVIFFFRQAHLTAFRRPLYTPGGYVKLVELKDEFCKFARGDRASDHLMISAKNVVKGRSNYPYQCPVPTVRRSITYASINSEKINPISISGILLFEWERIRCQYFTILSAIRTLYINCGNQSN